MNYKIHGSTVFIEGNGIIGHYKVNGDTVLKITEHISGNDLISDFHKLGDLPLNTEAKLLNKLRDKQLI